MTRVILPAPFLRATPQVQWLTTNGGTDTTYNANVPSGSGQQIRGIGIDDNDDICGTYTGRATTSGVWPYISINNGSGRFTTYTPTSGTDSWSTAMTTPTTVGGVTSGLAVGFGEGRRYAKIRRSGAIRFPAAR